MRRALLLLALAAAASADEVAKAQAIAKAGPEAAREAIPQLIALGKGGPSERFAARDALVVAGPHAVVPLIGGASGDQSLRLLLEGVSFDLGAAVVAPALPMLAADAPKVRAAAAVCLGAAGRGGEAAVKKLIEALYDKDGTVRREAATALGRIGRGAHDAVPALILLANDRERDATREGILALGMIVRDAAERARPKPKLAPEVASAIEKGLAWLAVQPEPEVPAARAYFSSLALLAMLESGARDRYATQIQSALRRVVSVEASDYGFDEPYWVTREPVTASLCAAARVLREPECEAAAEEGVRALAVYDSEAWRALAILEAGFAGLLLDPAVRDLKVADCSAVAAPLVGLAAGKDPKSEGMRRLIDSCDGNDKYPDSWLLAARARWYGGVRWDSLVESVLKRQREDGSWDPGGNALGAVNSTACMLLALEAASGLAHPLTMPLPDAPQLKAAVVTLKLASQSQEKEIRKAAEQALAGFR